MPSTPLILKVDNDSKLAAFITYYETAHKTINENGRSRKGNVKKFLLQELEELVTSGNPKDFPVEAEAFQKKTSGSPILVDAMSKLSPDELKQFKMLLQKAQG